MSNTGKTPPAKSIHCGSLVQRSPTLKCLYLVWLLQPMQDYKSFWKYTFPLQEFKVYLNHSYPALTVRFPICMHGHAKCSSEDTTMYFQDVQRNPLFLPNTLFPHFWDQGVRGSHHRLEVGSLRSIVFFSLIPKEACWSSRPPLKMDGRLSIEGVL